MNCRKLELSYFQGMFFISGSDLKGRHHQLNVHGNWMNVTMILRKELELNINHINNIVDNQKNIDEKILISYEKRLLDLGFHGKRRKESRDPNCAARVNLFRGLLLNLYLFSISLE